MKKLTIILLLITSFAFGQEAIYNTNSKNLHLINYAYFQAPVSIKIDNSLDFYNKDEYTNSSNLFFSFKKILHIATPAINIKYDYLNANNNLSSIDLILQRFHYINRFSMIYYSINLGYINNNISYSNLDARYSFEEYTNDENKFTVSSFNWGLSALFISKYAEFGFSTDHLNKPEIPNENNEEIPIKYSAFIRGILYRKVHISKFVATLVYQYQDKYFFNNIDLDYYFNTLNYLGINFDYTLNDFNFGIGLKMLSNNKDIISTQIGYLTNRLGFNYSISFMKDKNLNNTAIFNQIGIYYSFPVRKRMGRTMFCPSF